MSINSAIQIPTIYLGMNSIYNQCPKTKNEQQQENNLFVSGIASGILNTPLQYAMQTIKMTVQTKHPTESLFNAIKSSLISNRSLYPMMQGRNAAIGAGLALGTQLVKNCINQSKKN